MTATLKITEIGGKKWDFTIPPNETVSIGRSRDNDVALNDQRVSRYHAHIRHNGGQFVLVDGHISNGELKRSVNKVFVNGRQFFERVLAGGDRIAIGGSEILFEEEQSHTGEISKEDIRYDDQPLGHTQMLVSAKELISNRRIAKTDTEKTSSDEIEVLRRKAQILELLYELSKTLGSVFDLKEIFTKATDLIFRVTPADRVVALLVEDGHSGLTFDNSLYPIAVRSRNEMVESLTGRMTLSRTITQKVMREKVSLLSQDAKSDAQFSGSESIVAQGVRSTICAPLLSESGVHGVVYADRLDPFATFSPDDLELITAVAAQTAMAVETIKAHDRLAREEVARANYSRFLPEYVVKEILEKPDSFRLGGVNQVITVLFADIRGFTALAEKEKPEQIVTLLNRYFTEMTEIIFEHGGTLDKYIGDGLMALFGAPQATPDDAENAIKTAIAMQKSVTELNAALTDEGHKAIGVGIGLHTGEAIIGYIGSEKRSEYTAIGDTVNLAARLEANAGAGQILVSDATIKACNTAFPMAERDQLKVKNRVEPVTLFEVKWS